VTALLIIVALSMPHRGGPEKVKNRGAITNDESTGQASNESSDKSLFPITDSGRPAAKERHQGFLNERDLQRTVIRSPSNASLTGQTNRAGTLGSIPPFEDQAWQAYLLARNIRYEEDLVDQLFNSSEKRLARILLLLAHFGKEGVPETVIPKISQKTLAEMIGTTRSRVSFFMNRFRELGFLDYDGGSGLQVHSSLLNIVLHD
jgi:hypothetical protein